MKKVGGFDETAVVRLVSGVISVDEGEMNRINGKCN